MQHDPIPRGICQCGCGRKTRLAGQTHVKDGHVKGEPMRFIRGHGRRQGPVDYLVDDAGCWVWQRGRTTHGYGMAWDGGKLRVAHRVYYERHVGQIPEGLQIDHLCRNRACVNPAHLEPVTASVNQRRAARDRKAKAEQLLLVP